MGRLSLGSQAKTPQSGDGAGLGLLRRFKSSSPAEIAMVAAPCLPDRQLDADRCCRAIARLLRLRQSPGLSEQHRRVIARRLIVLCDQLQARCLA